MKSCTLLLIFAVGFLSLSAQAKEAFSAPSNEYLHYSANLSRALQLSSGPMRISSTNIPGTVKESYALFDKVCRPNVENFKYTKTVEVERDQELTRLNFQCQSKDPYSSQLYTIQFVASLSEYDFLRDLQILQLNSDGGVNHDFDLREGGEVLVAVAAGTLASGLLAQGVYPNQHDKVLHAIVGSLISTSVAAISYYRFDVDKNKAFWIGVASGIIAGLLKEVYDSHHRDRHTVDSNDAIATGMGGALGGLMIRIKFEF